MIPHLFYYQLVILGLLWLCVMLHLTWPSRAAMSPQKLVEPEPIKPTRQHSIESKPFEGLTQKPPCALCAHEAAHPTPSSPVRPAPIPPTSRRPREVCTACKGYFPEHHGTLFHGKRVSVDLIVHVIGCLAEGLGIRGTARVFEVDPNTVLHWLMEAAEQLRAFAQYFLHDLHLTQVQLDELYAVLSALKEGTVSEEGAIERCPVPRIGCGRRSIPRANYC
jgi:transposase-like protein